MLVDTKQIHLYCDFGSKRVILIDSHQDKVIFARTHKKERILGEYLALSLTLRYIKSVYRYRDILIITDAKSQSDVLNGNSQHSKNNINKGYSDNLKTILEEIRYTNIVNILWMPRKFNHAGRIMAGFGKEKLTLYATTNYEEVNFDTLEKVQC